MRLVVFGPGYSGSAAIGLLRPQLERVAATARTPEAAAALEASGRSGSTARRPAPPFARR